MGLRLAGLGLRHTQEWVSDLQDSDSDTHKNGSQTCRIRTETHKNGPQTCRIRTETHTRMGLRLAGFGLRHTRMGLRLAGFGLRHTQEWDSDLQDSD